MSSLKVMSIINSIKRKGSFSNNLAQTLTSNSLVYVFNFLTYPILTRLFSPEAYGEYAIWTLLLNNIYAISNLGYNDALIICNHRRDYYRLGAAITFLSLFVLLIFGIIYIFFESLIWDMLNSQPLWWIIFMIPQILLLTVYSIFSCGNVRFGMLARSTKRSGYFKIISKCLVLVIGFFFVQDGFGLYLGDLVFSILMVLFIFPKRNSCLLLREILNFDFKGSIDLLKNYLEYPKYLFPSLWIVSFIQQIPVFFITHQFKERELGIYVFCWGILIVPISLAVKSIRPVFFHKNLEMRNTKMNVESIRRNINKFLVVQMLGCIMFCLVAFFSIEIFYDLIFGDKWLGGKRLMQSMTVGAAGLLIVSPMSSILKVNGKLQLDLKLRIFVLLFLGGIALVLSYTTNDLVYFSLIYNTAYFITCLILLFFQLNEFKFSSNQSIIVVLKFLGILSLYGLIVYGLTSLDLINY